MADDGGAVEQLPPLPDDLAELAADATLACVDVVESSTRAVTSVRKGDLDPKAYADCLAEAVPPEEQREALVATMAGRYDDPAVINARHRAGVLRRRAELTPTARRRRPGVAGSGARRVRLRPRRSPRPGPG